MGPVKKKLVFLAMIFTAIFLVSCANTTQKNNSDNVIRVSYQIKKENKSLSKKTVTVKKGASVLTGLKNAWPVKTENKMVTKIDGHAQNPDLDQYWLYDINGKESKMGVDQQKLNDQDKVVFILKDISK